MTSGKRQRSRVLSEDKEEAYAKSLFEGQNKGLF